ncbi:unnamed protein product [Phaeothamnion confervicola]
MMPLAPVRSGLRMMATPDLKAAEAEAKRLTEEHGRTSPQAAAAWDAFEEMAAADNSIAMRPGLDESCEVENSALCAEYEAQMEELESIINASKPSLVTSLKQLAEANRKLLEENSRLRRSLSAYK